MRKPMANSRILVSAPPIECSHSRVTIVRLTQSALQMLPLAVLFIAWEVASRSSPGLALMLPPPTEVQSAGAQLVREGSLQRDILASLQRVFVALGVAAAIGLPLGLLIGMSKRVSWFFEPIINF